MASNCLRCTYPPGSAKGKRTCRKCGKPENVPKHMWHSGLRVDADEPTCRHGRTVNEECSECAAMHLPEGKAQIDDTPISLEDLIGEAPADPPTCAPTQIAGGESGTCPAASTAAPDAEPLYDEVPRLGYHVTWNGQEFVVTALGPNPNPIPATIITDTLVDLVGETDDLPEHSPFGGSGAKRGINCSGSVQIIRRLGLVSDESEFSSYGHSAHALAYACLVREVDAWEIVTEFEGFDPADAAYVQEYVDYVRSRPGRRRYEVFHHRPDLHKYMYGQIDAELVPVTDTIDPGLVLEIIDFKFGEGQYVDVERNEQGMYYAALAIMEDQEFFPLEGRVRITIAQPRMAWAGPTIRSWETTVEEIINWLYEELLPAMNREELSFSMGEWCRFCPAKLMCPAQHGAFEETATQAALGGDLAEVTDDDLSERYAKAPFVRMYLKALEAEVYKRLMDRKEIPSAKLVAGKSDRCWKPEAADKALAKFGTVAYTVPSLLSPAQMERLPGGKEFVAEWAYKPEAGYTVAPADDKRRAVTPKSGAELFASSLKNLDT